MTKKIAKYYAKIQDMPDKEYEVEILEDGLIKRIAVNGVVYDVDYNHGGDSIYSIIMNNQSHGVQISSISDSEYEISHRGEFYQIELLGELDKIREAEKNATFSGRQLVEANMPGVIIKIDVEPGDEVNEGDSLCVLTAMKMENEIRAITNGIVKEIYVKANDKVALNEKIMVIEPKINT